MILRSFAFFKAVVLARSVECNCGWYLGSLIQYLKMGAREPALRPRLGHVCFRAMRSHAVFPGGVVAMISTDARQMSSMGSYVPLEECRDVDVFSQDAVLSPDAPFHAAQTSQIPPGIPCPECLLDSRCYELK